jgi:DNA repair protein RecN (Recombination protein N)
LITSLKILNYALIEHLDISFSEGMTSITGETGAGKSILMGGLSLVLGKRADLNVLKDDKKKCIVEASFLIDNYPLKEFFEEAELDYEAKTVLRREIVPGGKSRAFINDTPVTLDKINQLSDFLIDVHSQNENQSLFKSEYQFLVLDALANNDELLDEYRKHLNQFNQTQLEFNELLLKVNKIKQESDYNQFLFDELINEELSPDIMTSLKDEIDQLSNVEDLKLYLSQSIQIIDEDQIGLLTQLSILKTALNNAVNKSKSLSIFYERIISLDIDLKDVMDELMNKLEGLENNPSRLENLNQRLNKIQVLFQKHQVNNVADLIIIKEELKKKIRRDTQSR